MVFRCLFFRTEQICVDREFLTAECFQIAECNRRADTKIKKNKEKRKITSICVFHWFHMKAVGVCWLYFVKFELYRLLCMA